MSVHDLLKTLAIAPKSSRSNPQHLETNFHAKFSTFIHVHKVSMKICRPLCAFCCSHRHILGQNSIMVSLSYPYIMQLSLFKRFIYIT